MEFNKEELEAIEEQLSKAWNPINLQWLLQSENNKKKHIIDFDKYPEQKVAFSKLRLEPIPL